MRACKNGHLDRYANGVCKACSRAKVAKYRKANRDRTREQWRRASTKRYSNNQEYRLANQKAAREWAANNPERVKLSARVSSKKYAEKNPVLVRARTLLWRSKNQPRINYLRAMRRSMEATATLAWSEKEKIALVYRKAKEYGFQVDHIVPLSHPKVCGLHVWANLQLLSKAENIRKRNLHWPDMP